MTYASSAWEFAAEIHQLILQRLRRVLRTIGKILRRTWIGDLHVAFQIPHVYDCITKLCRQQAEVIQIMKMNIFSKLDKAKSVIVSIRGLNLAAIKCTTVPESRLPQ
jgi:hypothetical protein